ncbi:MAG: hypothetical protein NC235_08935 [Clostridiales bacterium]|nr:hypothetical protein [Clostridiales bacterium]MCM1435633.1 hypothetical protein [Ruminococcus flavefaciens]
MAIALFPFKIIATIIIFLVIAVIKTANFIIVLILTPLEILSDWLRWIFGIMTAVAVLGLIYAYLQGNISLMMMIGTLLGCGIIDFIFMAPELIMDFLSDIAEDICSFLDDIREDMWI